MALTGPKTDRRSTAKTAYGFLKDLQQYAREEPKRVYMSGWMWRGDEIASLTNGLGVDAPACGTVGCIAGNILTLRGKATIAWRADNAANAAQGTYFDWSNNALRALGIDHNTAMGCQLAGLFTRTFVAAPYGTRHYVAIVNDRIETFCRTYKSRLQATKIPAQFRLVRESHD